VGKPVFSARGSADSASVRPEILYRELTTDS